MVTRTISLELEAYEKLRAARRHPDESFSQVVLRATWPEETISAGELLAHLQTAGPRLDQGTLDRIDAAKRAEAPAVDNWTTR